MPNRLLCILLIFIIICRKKRISYLAFAKANIPTAFQIILKINKMQASLSTGCIPATVSANASKILLRMPPLISKLTH